MRRLSILLALPAAVLLLSGWQWDRHRDNEHRLAAVASELAGRPVGVHCPGFFARLTAIGTDAGSVEFDSAGRPSGSTDLDERTCAKLDALARNHGARLLDPDTAQALVTLAHESFHLRGIVDEAQTQCYAVQTVQLAAQRFGVPLHRARAVAIWALSTSPYLLPAQYWSPTCHNGGPWDLRRDTDVWP